MGTVKLKSHVYILPDKPDGTRGGIYSSEPQIEDSTKAGRIAGCIVMLASGVLICWLAVWLSHVMRATVLALHGGLR